MNGNDRWQVRAGALLAGVMAMLLGGCGESMPGKDVTVRSGYSFAGGAFQAEVAAIGLERLGYRVPSPAYVDASVLHDALRDGDMQLHLSYWHPLEVGFAHRFGGDALVERAGSMVRDVRHGYAIDRATAEAHGITNIDRLQDPELAKLFDADGNGMADLFGCNR
ncbi:MAG: glycine betaine ABC transporter substrate-binding protein, partial [Cyanobacteria bacterium J06639_1]